MGGNGNCGSGKAKVGWAESESTAKKWKRLALLSCVSPQYLHIMKELSDVDSNVDFVVAANAPQMKRILLGMDVVAVYKA